MVGGEGTDIPRPLYLDRIRPYIGSPSIKVLTGQRRVGKSRLLRQVAGEILKGRPGFPVVFVDKERNEFDDIRTGPDLLRHVEKAAGKKACAVFVDEVQEIEGFDKALRSLLAEGKSDIYCTGSTSELLSSEIATKLAGRQIEFRIFSLAFPEFLVFHDREANRESLEAFLRLGGLPYLMHLGLKEHLCLEFLGNLYQSILFRDVLRRHSIRHPDFLMRLAVFLADNVGSLVTAKSISDFLKSQRLSLSPSVVANYLRHLAAAFFVERVPRADLRGKRILEMGEKWYFEDLGLRHAISPYRQDDIGKVVENAVFHHLRVSGWSVQVGQLGPNRREIDFVCSRGAERMYVQACYLLSDRKTREREFGNLLAITDAHPKMVVSLDPLTADQDGIRHLGLLEFLGEWR